MATANNYAPSMSDAAVKAKTGKAWAQWFALLDKADANKLNHKDIATLLHDKYKVPSWWSQMVTVEYERARGLRVRSQTAGGFTLNASKTLGVDIAVLYGAIADAKKRTRWFPKGKVEITSTTANKYFRAKWDGGATRLEINTYAKGDGKAQITVQHAKFADTKAMEAMRGEWKKALERLAAVLL